jgi:prepilin-type N-terminal cleavage/methylation domain-containing protein/prepilin-type processing-associated H-X9-DG protein
MKPLSTRTGLTGWGEAPDEPKVRKVLDCGSPLPLSIAGSRYKAAENRRTPRRWRDSLAAFSLTELLVVIAILALLTATQLPALGRAKVPVKHTQCMNNLRQLGMALQIHVADTRGFPYTADGNTTNIWYDAMAAKYANNFALMQCPSFKGEWPIENAIVWISGIAFQRPPSGPGKIAGVSYGYNGYGMDSANSTAWTSNHGLGWVQSAGQPTLPIKASAVVAPADMIAMADSMPMPEYPSIFSFLLSINTEPTPERHHVGYNVAFVDGHVVTIPHKQLVEDSDANRRRWNIDHEPHNEIEF